MATDEDVKNTEKITKELKTQDPIHKRIADSATKTSEAIQKISKLVDGQKTALDAIAQAQFEVQNTQLRNLTTVEQQNTATEALLKSYNDQITSQKTLVGQMEQQREQLESMHAAGEKIEGGYEAQKKLLDDNQNALADTIKDLEEYRNRIAKANTSYQIQVGLVSEIGSGLGLAANVSETWLGKTEQIASALANSDVGLKGIADGLKQTLAPANIFASATSKVVQSTIFMAKEMDSTIAEFNRATGAGGAYNEAIDEIRFGSLGAGVGIEQTSAALKALHANMADFTSLSGEMVAEIGTTTAMLERMGIGAETTAQNLDIATKALGMSTEQAIQNQLEIAATATELGIAPAKMAADFGAAMPQLAAYGRQATQVFKELQVQSKATNLEMQTLLGLTAQFDTFEGAAEAAGKLNAMLGGNLLNSAELLTATESERIDMLRQSIQLSGKNFNEMSKFEQKAVAATVGITDMTEASRLFGTTEEEFRRHQAAVDADALSTEELRKAAEAGTAAQEKFMLMIQALSSAALPLVDVMGDAMNAILRFADGLGGDLVGVLLLVTGLMYGLQKAVSFLSAMEDAAATAARVFGLAKKEEIAQNLTAITVKQTEAGVTIELATAEQIEAAATAQNTATENISQGVKKKGLILRARELASKAFSTAATWAENAAIAAMTGVMLVRNGVIGAYNTIKGIYTAITAGATAATIAETIAVGFATVALFAYNVVTGIAAAITTVFGVAVAIATSPITLIVVAILAAIAAVAALIIYWDEITGVIQEATGGFFDLWDVLLLLGGPVTAIILAGKKIYENWEPIKLFFLEMAASIKSAFDSILTAIKSPLNAGVDFFNEMIQGFNLIPGVDIPMIPRLAKGTTGFQGGMAMVGENGPELVTIPRGANVITNENVEKLSTVSHQVETARAEEKARMAAGGGGLSPAAAGGLDAGKMSRPVVLKINERELGRVIINILDKEMKLNTVSN